MQISREQKKWNQLCCSQIIFLPSQLQKKQKGKKEDFFNQIKSGESHLPYILQSEGIITFVIISFNQSTSFGKYIDLQHKKIKDFLTEILTFVLFMSSCKISSLYIYHSSKCTSIQPNGDMGALYQIKFDEKMGAKHYAWLPSVSQVPTNKIQKTLYSKFFQQMELGC